MRFRIHCLPAVSWHFIWLYATFIIMDGSILRIVYSQYFVFPVESGILEINRTDQSGCFTSLESSRNDWDVFLSDCRADVSVSYVGNKKIYSYFYGGIFFFRYHYLFFYNQ